MMKNKTLAVLFLIFVPFVGLREGATSSTMSMPTKGIFYDTVSATEFLPIVDTDLNDLDVRDAQNRPLKSVEAQSYLTSLFMENLFNLIAVAPSHSIQQTMDGINAFLNLFKSLFFASAPPILKALEEALAPSKRRFVHNVHNLWITISIGMLMSLLLTRNYCFERSVLKLNLRC